MADTSNLPVDPATLGWGTLLGGIGSALTPKAGTLDPTALYNMGVPWASQMPQYQSMLSGLTKDPTSFLQSPLFTKPLQLGGENVARQFGAQGMSNSGNVDAALQDYGQTFANNYLQQWMRQLQPMAGVGWGNPTGAAGLASGAQQFNIGQRAGSLTGGLSALASLLGGLLGTPGSAIGSLVKALTGGGSGGGGGLGTGDIAAPPTDPASGGVPNDPNNPWNAYGPGYGDPSITDPSQWLGGSDPMANIDLTSLGSGSTDLTSIFSGWT